jgi:hypothetical protein
LTETAAGFVRLTLHSRPVKRESEKKKKKKKKKQMCNRGESSRSKKEGTGWNEENFEN